MLEQYYDLIGRWHEWSSAHPYQRSLVVVFAVVLLAWASYYVARGALNKLVRVFARRTKKTWDDSLIREGALDVFAHMAPGFVVLLSAGPLPGDTPTIQRLVNGYLLLVATRAAVRVLGGVEHAYSQTESSKLKSIKSYVQLAQLFFYLSGGLIVLALVMQKNPLVFISGLGAMSAVLMLVFKDTILSLVASVQIAGNDMIRVGDWIEVPGHGADGDVIEIALHTVKVQNWDKTVSTVPTNVFVTDGFKNWRGMSESGGRRIARAIYLDMTSVSFLSDQELSRLKKVRVLKSYMESRCAEVQAWNEKGSDGDVKGEVLNARSLTNLGTFRAYALHYLKHHPQIRQDMTCLVRQQTLCSAGIPLQIYCFTATTAWAEYEDIQSDVFDHLLAVIPEFGLRVFQHPVGGDFAVDVQRGMGPRSATRVD